MTPEAKIDHEYFQSMGVTFQPNFLGGAVGVIARYDLPRLYYSDEISSDELELVVAKINRNLNITYRGCGYYGQCSQIEAGFPDTQVFVLFADEIFYQDYKGNVGGL
tara:strand:+ start:2191 stop:2511 length:321 start_codon:yes stop_codon:yes gene_type:complete